MLDTRLCLALLTDLLLVSTVCKNTSQNSGEHFTVFVVKNRSEQVRRGSLQQYGLVGWSLTRADTIQGGYRTESPPQLGDQRKSWNLETHWQLANN